MNTEDALKYAPNVMVRKPFTGDCNSVFAGRDFNELQSARGLVYADGLLLSNLLAAHDARWVASLTRASRSASHDGACERLCRRLSPSLH